MPWLGGYQKGLPCIQTARLLARIILSECFTKGKHFSLFCTKRGHLKTSMSCWEWILQRLSFSVIRDIVFLKYSLHALTPASPQWRLQLIQMVDNPKHLDKGILERLFCTSWVLANLREDGKRGGWEHKDSLSLKWIIHVKNWKTVLKPESSVIW